MMDRREILRLSVALLASVGWPAGSSAGHPRDGRDSDGPRPMVATGRPVPDSAAARHLGGAAGQRSTSTRVARRLGRPTLGALSRDHASRRRCRLSPCVTDTVGDGVGRGPPIVGGDPTRSVQTHPWIGDGSKLVETAHLLEQSAPKPAESGAGDGSISAFLADEWVRNRGAIGGYAAQNTPKTAGAKIPKSLSPLELTAAMFAEQFIDSYVPQNKRPRAFSAYRAKQAGQPSQTVAPSRRCWRGPTSTPSQGQQIYPRTL